VNAFLKDLKKIPVLRVLLPFGSGIVLNAEGVLQGAEQGMICRGCLVVALSLLIFLLLFFRKLTRFPWFLGLESVFLGLVLIFTGMTWSRLSRDGPGPQMLDGALICVAGTVSNNPIEKEGGLTFTIHPELWYSDTLIAMPVQELLVYLTADSLPGEIEVGERWLIRGRLNRIRNRGNPGEFDYAAYMAARETYYKMFIKPGDLTRLGNPGHRKWVFWPQRAASRISKDWDGETGSDALLRAICLGDKSFLSGETRQEFADSGAMHLLAVSGLHIGMIWWILNMIIRLPMNFRVGRILKALMVLSILWFYASITGFSSSVTRSVSMFTIVTLTGALSRSANIYNTILLSMLILLIIQPDRIGDAGFQLSYAAVLGIVSIYPLLRKMLRIRNKIAVRITELMLVSISAQVATLPLALFYFGQFPVWFILTNLVSIPLVSLLMACFVISSPFLLSGWQAGIINDILRFIAGLLETVIDWISGLPGAVILVGKLPEMLAICLYLLIFFIVLLGMYRRVTWLITVLVSASIAVAAGTPRGGKRDANQMIIYNFYNASVIRFQKGYHTVDFTSEPLDSLDQYTRKYLAIEAHGFAGRSTRDVVNLDKLRTDTMEVPGVIRIDQELWLIGMNGRNIAICGKCDPAVLANLAERFNLSEIVFREGYRSISRNIKLPDRVTAIADGTVNFYESQLIKNRLNRLIRIQDSGAYIIDIQ